MFLTHNIYHTRFIYNSIKRTALVFLGLKNGITNKYNPLLQKLGKNLESKANLSKTYNITQ